MNYTKVHSEFKFHVRHSSLTTVYLALIKSELQLSPELGIIIENKVLDCSNSKCQCRKSETWHDRQ